jgi:DNA-binding transcriptional LysR family regulator
MDVRQLTYFVAVAEERTFTAAALRLNLAQSAVSNAIRALERELGAVLFTRGAREVALTDAGAALLPRAHEAIATLSAARAAVDEVVGGLRGEVRIGTLTSTPTQVDLPALLGDFHHSHPAVHLHLVVSPEGSHGLVRDLVGGRLDVAFVGLADPASAGIHLREIARVPLDLIVPATHRLGGAAPRPHPPGWPAPPAPPSTSSPPSRSLTSPPGMEPASPSTARSPVLGSIVRSSLNASTSPPPPTSSPMGSASRCFPGRWLSTTTPFVSSRLTSLTSPGRSQSRPPRSDPPADPRRPCWTRSTRISSISGAMSAPTWPAGCHPCRPTRRSS